MLALLRCYSRLKTIAVFIFPALMVPLSDRCLSVIPIGPATPTEDAVYLGFLIIVILGLALLFWYMSRLDPTSKKAPRRGFTVEDLQELRRQGKLSDHEFVRMNAVVAKGWRIPPTTEPQAAAPAGPESGPCLLCSQCGRGLLKESDRCPFCGTNMRPKMKSP